MEADRTILSPEIEKSEIANQSDIAAGDLAADVNRVDEREQLVNGCKTGALKDVSIPKDLITSVHAVMFDLDPKLIRKSTLVPTIPPTAEAFYQEVVRPWTQRHPLVRNAEIRKSGTGIHALLWIDPAIEIESDSDRERWDGIIKTVQASLPIDPDQPSINARTRPVGSINGKNNQQVAFLEQGKPVTADQLIAFHEEMVSSWFRVVFKILTGAERLSPCPICQKEGSTLSAIDRAGRCYESCGTVKLDQLYDVILKPKGSKEVAS